ASKKEAHSCECAGVPVYGSPEEGLRRGFNFILDDKTRNASDCGQCRVVCGYPGFVGSSRKPAII
ncbi:MAG TPA: hypothetical protein VHI52_08920, partial [Verrucomicrobiae bacterium]|nr:hypothetical protein [Verrucomicrobiae bacterium]